MKFPQLLFPGGIGRVTNPTQLLSPPKGACGRFRMLPLPKTLPGLQMLHPTRDADDGHGALHLVCHSAGPEGKTRGFLY